MFGFIWSSVFLVLSVTVSVVMTGGLIGWPISAALEWGLSAAVILLGLAGIFGLLSVPEPEVRR